MFRSKLKIFSIFSLLALSFYFLQGCGEDSVSTQADNVDFSVMSSSDSVGNNIGILILDTVKVLIKDIKLNVANNNQDSTNFKVGPYVLYLNMASSLNIVSIAYIPPGTYDKVKFDIHKLSDNETPPDPDFVDINGRYSVVVKGRYSGVSFVFKSDKSAHQKLTFPGNLQVSASGKSNITLHAKPYIWFIKNGVYLDPGNPTNHGDIENNIKDNINAHLKVFVDNDRNGQPD